MPWLLSLDTNLISSRKLANGTQILGVAIKNLHEAFPPELSWLKSKPRHCRLLSKGFASSKPHESREHGKESSTK